MQAAKKTRDRIKNFPSQVREMSEFVPVLRIAIAVAFYAGGGAMYAAFSTNVLGALMEDTYGVDDSGKGLVLGISGLTTIVFLLLAGTVSDDFRSRFGPRIPFIFFGGVLASFAFLFAPIVLEINASLFTFILIYFVVGVGTGIAGSPFRALLSELFQKKDRGWAGLCIMLLGTVGTGVVISLNSPDFLEKELELFWYLCGGGLFITTILTCLFVPKVNPDFAPDSTIQDLVNTPKYVVLFGGGQFRTMLVVQLFWAIGIELITVYLIDFVKDKDTGYGLETTDATTLLFAITICGALFAVPSGAIVSKLGKVKSGMLATILYIGYIIIVTTGTYDIALWTSPIAGLSTILLSTVQISLPADLVPEGKEAQFMAINSIVTGLPIPFVVSLSSFVVDAAGYKSIFITAAIFMGIAGVILLALTYEQWGILDYQRYYSRYLAFQGQIIDLAGKPKELLVDKPKELPGRILDLFSKNKNNFKKD
ncbi:MAG: MFS transporter [Candidatus Hodarchaeota archaeon]